MSGVVRALLDDNDEADGNDGNPLMGLRKLDPIPTLAMEKRFLEAAHLEFWKGTSLALFCVTLTGISPGINK